MSVVILPDPVARRPAPADDIDLRGLEADLRDAGDGEVGVAAVGAAAAIASGFGRRRTRSR
jgi:hypothetical protein